MYRPPRAAGRAGAGVSADGYDGAEKFFDQVKTIAGELKIPGLPTGASESAAAKAAVDAYMTARNGIAPPEGTFGHNGMPNDFPQIDLKADVGKVGDATSPLSEIGKAVSELMSHMGDMVNQMIASPMGFLSNLLGFLCKMFSEMAEGIGQALAESAHAIASVVEDAWKKQMELASSSQAGLQPLELYNQAATTQTLSHALKNTAST